MPHNMNKRALIEDIKSKGNIVGRYEELTCMNFDIASGERTGVLSLVFKGKDILLDKPVAIKFMDPDRLSDDYRVDCFHREPEILKRLDGKRRCLQLVADIATHDLVQTFPGMPPIKLPCKFFVLGWLNQEIEHYFKNQQDFDAYEKLTIFHKMVLAVAAIHDRHIHHRDLKPDNMRAFIERDGKMTVVIIDFGTAAHALSESLKHRNIYDAAVGAPYFASPEARMGFSGERSLGCATDIYALGCMLHGLFNLYPVLHKQLTPEYRLALSAINLEMTACKSIKERYQKWREVVPRFRHMLQPPPLEGPGHTLPGSIGQVMSRLYLNMMEFDFDRREANLQKILHQINIARKILLNSKASIRDLERRKQIRSARQEKAQAQKVHVKQIGQKTGAVQC